MLEIRNVSKIYRSKTGEEVKALDNVSISFPETGMVFILGKSGSGKSTLLNVMGGLDSYDGGEFIIKGKSSNDFVGSDFDAYRNTFIGFIFQEYNVLDDFTVGANIGLALELQGKKATDEAVNGILAQVDLLNYAKRKPNELSGGQKQRVAIARALVKDPEIIMADEPTGALDSNTGKQIFDTLKELSKTKLVLIVSHDRDFAERYADRIVELADGKIIEDVTKHEHQAERVSEGVHRINDHILRIESGYKLTAKDLEMINAYLAKNNGDVLLSGDGRVNEELRSAAGISKDGATTVFEETDPERDIKSKKYEKDETKFIRSRLPMKNAIKMGSSSLKHKKFRLFMTILLSFISFAMFGLSSSMAAYDKLHAATSSIIDSQIRSAAMTLGVRRTTTYEDGDTWTSHDGQGFNQDDIDFLKAQTGLEFVPVFTGYSYADKWSNQGGFNVQHLMSNYQENTVYTGKIAGFVAMTQDKIPSDYSVIGRLPEKTGEIALTEFMYRQFKQYGFKDAEGNTVSANNLTMNNDGSANDLIGKTININQIGWNSLGEGNDFEFTVVGIVNTNFNYDRYASLMPVDETQQQQQQQAGVTEEPSLMDMFLENEIKYERDYGFHALAFAHADDIEDMTAHMANNSFDGGSKEISEHMSGGNGYLSFYIYKPAEGINDPQKVASVDRVGKSDVLDRLDGVYWLKEEKPTLAETEVLIPTSMLTQVLGSKTYDIDYSAFDAAMLANSKINNDTYSTENTNRIWSAKNSYNGTEEEFYADVSVQNAILALYGMTRPTNMSAEGARYLGERLTHSSISYEDALYTVAKMQIANLVVEKNYDAADAYKQSFVKKYLTSHNYTNSYWSGTEAGGSGQPGGLQTDEARLNALVEAFYSWEIRNDPSRFETTRVWLYETALNIYLKLTSQTQDDLVTLFDGYVYQLDMRSHVAGSEDELEKIADLENFKVVGFFTREDNNSSEFVVSTTIYDKWKEWQGESYKDNMVDVYIPNYTEDRAEHEQGVWAFVVAPISADNEAAIQKLVELSYSDPDTTDLLFEMQNAVMYTLGSFNDIIETLSQVFVWVGLALAVFSSFLLMNFISTSISYKKREIGILRAVGARSSDVFKIFFSEAFIIAIINFVMATAASIAAVIILNMYMRNSGINITLLSFGPLQVLIMLGVSVLVAAIASFLPVYKIAHKKPVDAIKDR